MRRWAVPLLAAVAVALVSTGCGSGRVAGSPQSPLTGRNWVVTGIVTLAGTAPIPAGTRAYLLFGPGAKVTGFCGCNSLAGRVRRSPRHDHILGRDDDAGGMRKVAAGPL
jgi:heat shock protein HslJ